MFMKRPFFEMKTSKKRAGERVVQFMGDIRAPYNVFRTFFQLLIHSINAYPL